MSTLDTVKKPEVLFKYITWREYREGRRYVLAAGGRWKAMYEKAWGPEHTLTLYVPQYAQLRPRADFQR